MQYFDVMRYSLQLVDEPICLAVKDGNAMMRTLSVF